MKSLKNIQGTYHAKSIFVEQVQDADKKTIIRGLMLPKDKISRNGVLYEWESIKTHHKELINKCAMYNHKLDTEMPPVGHYTDSICLESSPDIDNKWYKVWQKTTEQNGKEIPGWYYEADLNPDNIYTKSVLRGDLNKVSIQLFADQSMEMETADGSPFVKAYVGSILEASLVVAPGYEQTSIEVALAEAFKLKHKEQAGVPKRDGTGPNNDSDTCPINVEREEVAGFKHAEDPDENFNSEQLEMGIEMEQEHTDDLEIAKSIAKAHLSEIPDYYTRLKKMEDEAKSEKEDLSTDNVPTGTKLLEPKLVEYIDSITNEEAKSIYEDVFK